MGTLVCETDYAYLPAFFTSVDDDTLGCCLGLYSTGVPAMASNGETCLDLTQSLDSAPSLNNLRIRYADRGLVSPSAQHSDVWDCQFLTCNRAIVAGQSATVAFHNSLVASCTTAVSGAASFPAITGEHLTADVTSFWGQGQPSQIALVNSIILGSVATGPALSTDHTALNPSATTFDPDGWGNYYLARTSSYLKAGSTSVSTRLLSEFQQKTTQAPLGFPGYWQLSGELTLGPQVARYTSGAPDYGYYYPALDYALGWTVNLGTITVLPGTALGFRNGYLDDLDDFTYWGLDLREGSQFISHGTPVKPIVLADVQLVQEQSTLPCVVLVCAWGGSRNPLCRTPLPGLVAGLKLPDEALWAAGVLECGAKPTMVDILPLGCFTHTVRLCSEDAEPYDENWSSAGVRGLGSGSR